MKEGRNKSYFTNDLLDSCSKYSKYNASNICQMIEFVVDNVCEVW